MFLFASGAEAKRAEAPIQVKQGDIVRLVLEPGESASAVSGRFKKHSIPFFEAEKGLYVAILGIDMNLKAGSQVLTAAWKREGKSFQKNYSIEVRSADFPLQKLTLPKGMVDLDPKTLVRVRGEKSLMKAAFRKSTDTRLWRGAFMAPVKGKRQGTFGRRRVLNGKPRRPHTGEDISAPSGTPIVAPNAGVVVLVGHFFFNGRSVVIDHGLGLFSMYFHLSATSVEKGARVKKGERIGRVGASGRVTGPHLHWGMRLNNARIDPFSLVNKQLD